MSSPFPCNPVIREWSGKKTQIENKNKKECVEKLANIN